MDLTIPLSVSIPSNILFDIAIMLIAATAFALIAKAIKQPLIPAYIITGLLIGPILGIIHVNEEIQLLSELGVAFLLFIVGLEISFKKIKDVGFASFAATLPQIFLIFLVGLFIASKFFLSSTEAIYLGFILAFSSTMVVVKTLADRREINTLHGRIVLGIMLVQDLIVLFVIPSVSSSAELSVLFFALIFLKIIIMVALAIVLSKYVLNYIFEKTAKSSELLFLTSLSMAFIFMVLSWVFDLSIIIGSFIAGVALANLPYNVDIIAKIRPLRDFFATLFFVSLGLQFVPVNLTTTFYILFAVLLFAVIFLKPLIVFLIVLIMGYKDRTAFLSGISIGQVSEFSLIIASQAFIAGKISQDLLSITILLAIFTITTTTYSMKIGGKVYEKFPRIFRLMSKITPRREMLEHKSSIKKDVLLLGCDNVGKKILRKLQRMKKNVFVVDSNPEIIKDLIEKNVPCMYGDVMNSIILNSADIKKAKIVISTIPDDQITEFLINYVKSTNKRVKLVVTARYRFDVQLYYNLGADYVIFPDLITGERMAHVIGDVLSRKNSFSKVKRNDLIHLK